MWGFNLWTLYYTPLIYIPVFMQVVHSLDCGSFVVAFEIRKSESSNFVLLFQDCFDYGHTFIVYDTYTKAYHSFIVLHR